MDFNKWIICVCYLAVMYICAYSLAMPLLEEQVNGMFLPDETYGPNDGPMSPVSDWDINELDGDEIENILKRNGFRAPDSYHRFPRIKERHIIPFYSYGNEYGGNYKPKPRYVHQPRIPVGYSPWNLDYNTYGGRFRSRGRY